MDYPKRYIMKILFFDSPAFAKQDMIDAFEDMNIACDLFFHESHDILPKSCRSLSVNRDMSSIRSKRRYTSIIP